jgi:co-chaperonin GroES (HSP10)
MSDKIYSLGGEDLTPEERENLHRVSRENEQKVKEMAQRTQEQAREKKMVTLEQLLRTRIQPDEDRVVVWRDPVETVTAGGVIKTQETIDAERPCMGTVLAVGPGKKGQSMLTNRLLLDLLIFTPIHAEMCQVHSLSCKRLQEELEGEEQMSLKPGDHIIFGRMAGTPVQDPDTKEELLIMRPMDIFGKIRS